MKRDKVDEANNTMVQAEFNDNFNPPCPVCRNEISYSGFIENILSNTPDGHPSYRRSGKIISNYNELKGDSKVSSLKDKAVIKYVKNVQMEHEKLKKQLTFGMKVLWLWVQTSYLSGRWLRIWLDLNQQANMRYQTM